MPDHAHPEFVPDAGLSREEMEAQQRNLAETASFADDLPFDPGIVGLASSGGDVTAAVDTGDAERDGGPVVIGVDQAFLEERAVSAAVAMRDGEVLERVHAVSPLEIPYIPG